MTAGKHLLAVDSEAIRIGTVTGAHGAAAGKCRIQFGDRHHWGTHSTRLFHDPGVLCVLLLRRRAETSLISSSLSQPRSAVPRCQSCSARRATFLLSFSAFCSHPNEVRSKRVSLSSQRRTRGINTCLPMGKRNQAKKKKESRSCILGASSSLQRPRNPRGAKKRQSRKDR